MDVHDRHLESPTSTINICFVSNWYNVKCFYFGSLIGMFQWFYHNYLSINEISNPFFKSIKRFKDVLQRLKSSFSFFV